jgi:hypothetical protein
LVRLNQAEFAHLVTWFVTRFRSERLAHVGIEGGADQQVASQDCCKYASGAVIATA